VLTRTDDRTPRDWVRDANGRKVLEDLLASQDMITAELAKDDPEALGDLQVLFEKTRRAAGSIDRQALALSGAAFRR
jgi:hypothetical protein